MWSRQMAQLSTTMSHAHSATAEAAATLSGKFKLVTQSCKDCHAEYRDKAKVQPRVLTGD